MTDYFPSDYHSGNWAAGVPGFAATLRGTAQIQKQLRGTAQIRKELRGTVQIRKILRNTVQLIQTAL